MLKRRRRMVRTHWNQRTFFTRNRGRVVQKKDKAGNVGTTQGKCLSKSLTCSLKDTEKSGGIQRGHCEEMRKNTLFWEESADYQSPHPFFRKRRSEGGRRLK